MPGINIARNLTKTVKTKKKSLAPAAGALNTKAASTRPTMPSSTKTFTKQGYNGQLSLQPGLKATAKTVNADMSPWLKLQGEKIAQEQKTGLDAAARGAATGAAEARSALASRGGLRGGAAERLAGRAAESRLMGQQGVLGQAAASKLGAETAAEQMGREAERFNVGQQTQAEQFNIGNLLGEIGRKDQGDLQKYGMDMSGWGAEQSAKAIRNSGKK